MKWLVRMVISRLLNPVAICYLKWPSVSFASIVLPVVMPIRILLKAFRSLLTLYLSEIEKAHTWVSVMRIESHT